MSDRFSRLLRLIRLLQDSRGRTVVELEHLLEVDRRTIYRYFEDSVGISSSRATSDRIRIETIRH